MLNLNNGLSFDEQLQTAIKENQPELIMAIIQNAKEGDASAMKAIVGALESGKFTEEEKVKIAPEQMRQIIKLAAERL